MSFFVTGGSATNDLFVCILICEARKNQTNLTLDMIWHKSYEILSLIVQKFSQFYTIPL